MSVSRYCCDLSHLLLQIYRRIELSGIACFRYFYTLRLGPRSSKRPFDVVVDFGAIELDKVDDLVVFVDVEVDETPRKMFSVLL